MKLQSEIPIICDTLMLTEADLAKKLGVSLETINAWKEVKEEIEPANLDKLYSFAYENGIDLNNIYEQLFKEEYEKKRPRTNYVYRQDEAPSALPHHLTPFTSTCQPVSALRRIAHRSPLSPCNAWIGRASRPRRI